MIVVCSLRSLCVKTAIIRICCAIPLPTSGELEGMFRQHVIPDICMEFRQTVYYATVVQVDELKEFLELNNSGLISLELQMF